MDNAQAVNHLQPFLQRQPQDIGANDVHVFQVVDVPRSGVRDGAVIHTDQRARPVASGDAEPAPHAAAGLEQELSAKALRIDGRDPVAEELVIERLIVEDNLVELVPVAGEAGGGLDDVLAVAGGNEVRNAMLDREALAAAAAREQAVGDLAAGDPRICEREVSATARARQLREEAFSHWPSGTTTISG